MILQKRVERKLMLNKNFLIGVMKYILLFDIICKERRERR